MTLDGARAATRERERVRAVGALEPVARQRARAPLGVVELGDLALEHAR